jgi:acetyl-CoA synthetase
MQATKAHRGLSTARAALRVTWLLARTPDGIRADEVAKALGKSVSTAYNLLASLCDEGVAERHPGGLYRLSAAFRETVAEESDRHDLSGVVDDLLARTHKRAYLAVLRNNQLRVVLERGLQGMPKLPGMNPVIADNAHALALGKVVLALGPRDAVDQYAAGGLKRFTPATITDPQELVDELLLIRLSGVAAEREEFEKDFCCLAAPVLDHERRFLGAVGISMSRKAFDEEREHLEETLRDVVGFQRSAEIRADLDLGPQPDPISLAERRQAAKRRMRPKRRPN